MLIAPTEPSLLKTLGKVSLIPESYGADILINTGTWGLVGIQRKEISDLIKSVQDGRLQKELGQMKQLGLGIVLVEGQLQWTTDGVLLSQSSWTLAHHLGTLWSIASRNYWTSSTISLTQTYNYISLLAQWLTKTRSNLDRRPTAKGIWGTPDNREWGIHLLQSFIGIGPEVAAAIYDYYQGVPIKWTVSALEMQQVPGVGPVRAERLIKSLEKSYPVLSQSELPERQSQPSPNSNGQKVAQ